MPTDTTPRSYAIVPGSHCPNHTDLRNGFFSSGKITFDVRLNDDDPSSNFPIAVIVNGVTREAGDYSWILTGSALIGGAPFTAIYNTEGHTGQLTINPA